jgi:hypothetical protein
MPIDRRRFLKTSAALAALESLRSRHAAAAPSATDIGPMAYSPATRYRPYVSSAARESNVATWVQIDLGQPRPAEAIRLYPAFHVGRKRTGYGFPLRWKAEVSDDASFTVPRVIIDFTTADCPDPDDRIIEYLVSGATARYFRFTATRLRTAPNGVGYVLVRPGIRPGASRFGRL